MNSHLPPGIGHNIPSPFDALVARVEELHAAGNKWAVTVKEIADAEQAAKCADFLDQVNAAEKATKKAKDDEKRPHLDANKAIELQYKPQELVLATIKGLLTPKQTAWLQKEKRRIAQEAAAREAEAKRLEDEAETERQNAARGRDPVGGAVRAAERAEQALAARRAANAAASARPQVAGEYGARAHSLRTHWTAEIVDLALAFVHYCDEPEVFDTLTRLARRDARAGVREIPGCHVFTVEGSA